MNELTWKRFRTSAPRTLTYHWAEGPTGTYDARKIGNDGYKLAFFHNNGTDAFIGAYPTLKEAKREAGYHARKEEKMTKKALIVVDMQNDFIGDDIFGDGVLSCQDGPEVAAHLGRGFIPKHGADYAALVSTQDWHVEPGEHFTEWPVHCVEGTRGAQIVSDLADVDFDFAVKKGHYSAAYSGFEGQGPNGWDLRSYLLKKGILHVDIVGVALEHCVKATALDAVKNGFTVSVLLPLTSSVKGGPLVTEAIEEMKTAGVQLVDIVDM